MNSTKIIIAFSTLLSLGFFGSSSAHGEKAKVPPTEKSPSASKLKCEVLEIEASNKDGGIDSSLKSLSGKLKKPPFSSWKRFKLLKRHDGEVEEKKTMKVGLVTDGAFSLLNRGANARKGKSTRLRLTFTLDDKSGERKVDGTINVDSGDTYLMGGDRLPGGGTYVLAVNCSL